MENSLENDWHQHLPCGVLQVRADGWILQANDFFCEMLGYTLDELVHQRYWFELLSMGGKIYCETHFIPLLLLQGHVLEVNFDFFSKKRIKIPALVNAKAVHDSSGSLQYFNIVVCEMQQRKRYEKELLIAKREAEYLNEQISAKNRDLASFARVVSHDLKAPLNNIVALISLINSKREQFDEETVELLHYIGTSTDKLKHLVDEILAFHTHSEVVLLQKQDIDFTLFMHEIIALLDPKQQHNFILPNHHPQLTVNRTAMQQIFINLINNAINYNRQDQAIIEIGLDEEEDFYHFFVKDNGIGIAKENLSNIFELFKTLGVKDRKGNSGTGIGLATVHKLVTQLGGNIQVESEENVGTCFYFSIRK